MEIDDPEVLASVLGQLCEAAGDYSRARRKGRDRAAQNWREVFYTALDSRVPSSRRQEILALVRESSCAGAEPAYVLELAPLPPVPGKPLGDAFLRPAVLEALIGVSSVDTAVAVESKSKASEPSRALTGAAVPGESALGYWNRTGLGADPSRDIKVSGRALASLLRLGVITGLGVRAALADGPDAPRVPSGPWKGLGRFEAARAFRARYAKEAGSFAGTARWPLRRHELLSEWVLAVDALARQTGDR